DRPRCGAAHFQGDAGAVDGQECALFGESTCESETGSGATRHSGRTAEEGLTNVASSDLMVGLEIGTSKICGVVGEGRTDGTIKLLGVGQAPSRGVRKGEIVDFETAMKCVHEAVVDAEQKSDVMIRSVYGGVAGGHIQSFNNRGCVTRPEDRGEIDGRDIEDRKNNAH